MEKLALLNQGMNCHSERNFVERRISIDASFRIATLSMTTSNSYFKSATPKNLFLFFLNAVFEILNASTAIMRLFLSLSVVG
jgi:hypothetical protein